MMFCEMVDCYYVCGDDDGVCELELVVVEY